MKHILAGLTLLVVLESLGLAWFYEREQRHVESFQLMQKSALGFWGAALECEQSKVPGISLSDEVTR